MKLNDAALILFMTQLSNSNLWADECEYVKKYILKLDINY